MSEEPKTTAIAEVKGVSSDSSETVDMFPDLYANVVKAHITPFELNMAFGRTVIPFESPEGKEVELRNHIHPVARVGVPLVILPSIIRLLERQLKKAYDRGFLDVPAEPGVPKLEGKR